MKCRPSRRGTCRASSRPSSAGARRGEHLVDPLGAGGARAIARADRGKSPQADLEDRAAEAEAEVSASAPDRRRVQQAHRALAADHPHVERAARVHRPAPGGGARPHPERRGLQGRRATGPLPARSATTASVPSLRPGRASGSPDRQTCPPAARKRLEAPETGPLRAGEPRYDASCADVAQLVEHFTRNEGVRGSSPRVGFA